jgi:hypothetical protein
MIRLLEYWMYFLTKPIERTSFFLLDPRPDVAVTPAWRSGLYFSKTGVSCEMAVSSTSPPTLRFCSRLSTAGVPVSEPLSQPDVGTLNVHEPSSTPGCVYRCMRRTCSEIMRSRCSSTSSVTMKSKSKRERSESGRAMLRCGSLCTSYC